MPKPAHPRTEIIDKAITELLTTDPGIRIEDVIGKGHGLSNLIKHIPDIEQRLDGHTYDNKTISDSLDTIRNRRLCTAAPSVSAATGAKYQGCLGGALATPNKRGRDDFEGDEDYVASEGSNTPVSMTTAYSPKYHSSARNVMARRSPVPFYNAVGEVTMGVKQASLNEFKNPPPKKSGDELFELANPSQEIRNVVEDPDSFIIRVKATFNFARNYNSVMGQSNFMNDIIRMTNERNSLQSIYRIWSTEHTTRDERLDYFMKKSSEAEDNKRAAERLVEDIDREWELKKKEAQRLVEDRKKDCEGWADLIDNEIEGRKESESKLLVFWKLANNGYSVLGKVAHANTKEACALASEAVKRHVGLMKKYVDGGWENIKNIVDTPEEEKKKDEAESFDLTLDVEEEKA